MWLKFSHYCVTCSRVSSDSLAITSRRQTEPVKILMLMSFMESCFLLLSDWLKGAGLTANKEAGAHPSGCLVTAALECFHHHWHADDRTLFQLLALFGGAEAAGLDPWQNQNPSWGAASCWSQDAKGEHKLQSKRKSIPDWFSPNLFHILTLELCFLSSL